MYNTNPSSYGYGGAPHHPLPPHTQQKLQQPGQSAQPLMYNPHPSYGMASGVGAGMMQNNVISAGIPAGSGGPGGPGGPGGSGGSGLPSAVPTYQTPYSSSPYGPGVPTSSHANLPPNFMAPTSNAPSYLMSTSIMNPQLQHQPQRMQPPSNASTPTPGSRTSPFGGMPHNTPPNATSTQSHLPTPENHNQNHLQNSTHSQQSHGGTILTPQTPNFPLGSQNSVGTGNSMASPMSPGSEVREKERVTLLLDINQVLLMEVLHLEVLRGETKKEESRDNNNLLDGSGIGEKEKAEKEKAEKLKATVTREYIECMRRLQSNLAYLAAIADRSHKPSSQIPPHPAIMFAPPIALKIPLNLTSPSNVETGKEESEDKKQEEDEEERINSLRELYKQLQALFPGVDPKKEQAMQPPNPAARTQAQQAAMQQQAHKQQLGGGQGQTPDPNQQQKMQNDLLRQKMMQAQAHAQQQQQLQNHQNSQGMQSMNSQQPQNR